MREYFELYKDILCSNNLSDYCTDEIIDNLYRAQVEIIEKNEHLNLTAIKVNEDFIAKHWADSLKIVKYVPQNAKVLDVGTGGGILALAIAISRKDVTVTALDSTEKKIAFVNELSEKLQIKNLSAISCRAEEYGHSESRESYDFVCARAVADLPVLCELCIPLVKKNGLFVSLKGKSGSEELERAKKAYETLGCKLIATDNSPLIEKSNGECTNSERFVFVFKKEKMTPKEYPRHYSKISKSPIN